MKYIMVDPSCVLVLLLKGTWYSREKRKEKNGKRLKTWKKWMQWNRIKWNDGSKVEFEKNYKKIKYTAEKEIKENIFNKNWN